ncbi:MAG: DNA-directed RNA polymerase subunit alpha [Candidatus Babeliaceae bacterium]|nr:DNA-directed RNA polymerase subunit alpha [Candidatus Babeliaceae bacterium]
MQKKEYQSLTIPQLAWNKQTLSPTFGELVVEPLEPGFGTTMGNALRRTLLGAVEGSAVTSVIIKGVNNEFSSVSGVVEDVVQIILNCKEIVVKNKTGQPGTMKLVVSGEGIATVADIQTDDHLELINKRHVIAHVAQGGVLDIVFHVESGRGYQAAKWPVGKALQEDNRIYIDAMFSPVRKVSYDVEKTRVGTSIDYDKLLLYITTDGTESPLEVVRYAVSVVRSQLEHFLAAPEIPFNEISRPVIEGKPELKPETQDVRYKGVSVELLLKPINALEFSVRAHNCLINAGIKRIIDLVNLTEDDVLKIKNFGRKSYDEVKEGMKSFGLSFAMNVKETDLRKLIDKE